MPQLVVILLLIMGIILVLGWTFLVNNRAWLKVACREVISLQWARPAGAEPSAL